MIERVTVRAAEPPDAEAIAEIWRLGWRDGHEGHVPRELLEARTGASFGRRAAARVGEMSVAVVDADVAGFVLVVEDEVEQVYVAAPHRGTGIASILLAEAERRVRAKGHGEAWLAVATGNARARAFYEREGWRDDGAFVYEAGDAVVPLPVPCHRYVKRL